MSVTRNQVRIKTLLANLLKARFPYLYIQTWEEDRILSVIRSVAQDVELIKTPREVLTWRITTGMKDSKGQIHSESKQPLKALEFIENYDRPCIVVLQDFHVFFGGHGRQADFQVIRKLRDMLVHIKQSRNPINVIITSPFLILPEDLQKDVTIVDFDLPTFEEIKSVLDEMIEINQQGGRINISLMEEEKERLAKAALGLTLSEAENAFARAMVEDGKLDITDVEVILEEKEQIIKKTGILEFINSELKMEDVGGLENLKRWLNKRNKSWLDSARKYGLPAPKGVLITGVPGCGKSLISKSISTMWQLPLLRLDMGKIFSGIVGSSEENMRKAIKTAEAISPSILWIDEIEKGFSGISNGGDSGTSSRIFGQFLTWMQEKTSPVFVISTANNISGLPPELMRKGRFDEIFFVDLPTHRERKEILKVHINKRLKNPEVMGLLEVTDEVLDELAGKCEGFVGAEIEQLVIDALFEAYSEDRSIQLADFERAIKNTVPLSVTQAEQIRLIRDWANVRAVTATPREDRVDYPKEPALIPSGSVDEDSDDDVRFHRGGRTIDF
ncbi:AAA family ATPase [Bacillus cereus]|uniref:AAA family ATPase n=1 Tax=Bacillus cereus TaxID=1396 RepID=UPI000BF81A94|nr:AAA family ATPase [Bacillus cereus]MCU7756670.1 AAA family ATPase [Bacillus cereus]MDA2627493.1 AAA family ATPase [Bacillus cereus]MDC7752726.1 AAA family ATPase [Bacillus cereus]PEV97803.1 ATPase [Bacillus cereus]PFD43314.1 ATPase [Bacillus cereus]